MGKCMRCGPGCWRQQQGQCGRRPPRMGAGSGSWRAVAAGRGTRRARWQAGTSKAASSRRAGAYPADSSAGRVHQGPGDSGGCLGWRAAPRRCPAAAAGSAGRRRCCAGRRHAALQLRSCCAGPGMLGRLAVSLLGWDAFGTHLGMSHVRMSMSLSVMRMSLLGLRISHLVLRMSHFFMGISHFIMRISHFF